MIDPTVPLSFTPEEQAKSRQKPPNSTSWKPGQSGNPKGYVKRDWTWKGELEQAVEEALSDGKTIKYHLARSLIKQGLKGNVNAIEKMMNRMDGMPLQATDITSLGDKLQSPLVIMDTQKEKDG